MGKIVILGCGYIGTNLANYFSANSDDEIIVYGHNNYYVGCLSRAIRFVCKGIEDLGAGDAEVFDGATVIDATGNTNATNKITDSSALFLNNCANKISLIQTISNMNINKYIFLSSGGTVYIDEPVKHNETDQTYPNNVYALEKITIENFLKLYSQEEENFPYMILRLSNPYGGLVAPQKKQGIIDVAIAKLRNGENVELFGDLENVRDYIYIDDLCKYIVEISKFDNNGEVFNVGSGSGYSLRDTIYLLEKVTGQKIAYSYRKGETKNIRYSVLDTKKINSYCNFPLVSLEEGIKKCYNGYKGGMR